jgi:flagellar biosynthesis anti-sigma factor FlgM
MKAVSGSAICAEVVQMTSLVRNPVYPQNIGNPSPVEGKAVSQENAVVRMSATSRMVQVARSAALSAPEIRSEAVEPLRDALYAGRYDFSPQRVAEKMVGRMAGFCS